jgi:hypothetical protein
MSKLFRAIVMAFAVVVCVSGMPDPADACPMCKTANETDDAKPRAYMYSILFMLSMPAMVFSGFSIAFYRLSRKSQLVQEMAARTESDDDPEHGLQVD